MLKAHVKRELSQGALDRHQILAIHRECCGLPSARRQRVYPLFDESQLAIHDGDGLKVDYLMAELAELTAQGYRAVARRSRFRASSVCRSFS